MHILHPKKIVVLGMMTRMPVAGVVWQTAHYLVGLQRLGYEVYYVEAHAMNPSMLMRPGETEGTEKAAAFIDDVCKRFGLAPGRWAYHALQEPGCRVLGMSDTQLTELYRSAHLIINLHGGTVPRPEHYQTGRLVYVETDPVAVQIELYENNQTTIDYLEPHCAFFTFGENYGRPGCGLPVSDRFHFRPTRQPVVCDFWESSSPPATPTFTTVGNWEQQWREVHYNGETYHWSKHHEFMKVIDLPRRVEAPVAFELALSAYAAPVEQLLQEHGWGVRPSLSFSMDPDAYRAYIVDSYGEFTVAKDQNVRLRSGWFSDRSATYLAAGRPVITQDTAFGNVLPTGEGLFAFSDVDEILNAVDALKADYPRHSRAARRVARECFEADVVLSRLLAEVAH